MSCLILEIALLGGKSSENVKNNEQTMMIDDFLNYLYTAEAFFI